VWRWHGNSTGEQPSGALAKQFQVSKEVEILRRGDAIVLREKKGTMVRAFELLAGLPKNFSVKGRGKEKPQKRKGL
jgi:hypothetical protein